MTERSFWSNQPRKWGLIGIPLLIAATAVSPMGTADTPPSTQEAFTRQIKPLLEKYCYGCHGANSNTGLDLTQYKEVTEIQRDQQNWRKTLNRITEKTMPPQGAPQPSDAEREMLTVWLGHTLANVPEHLLPKNPGRVLIRRLSRLEYNNTVRDLFGVAVKPADKFPPDAGGGGGFDNNADTLYIPPVLMERYLDAAEEVLAAAPDARIFVPLKSSYPSSEAAARETIAYHATRAYRRPVTAAELDSLMRLYSQARKSGDPHKQAVKFALKAVLVSPNFLFRSEKDTGASKEIALNDYEIASRLSYFLWASMPDDTLFRLAAQKRLRDPKVLDAQVRRMLSDPKARSFFESFAGQWLRVRELYTTAHPDPGRFPEYKPSLRDAMYQETVRFFGSIVTENRSVLRLLDSDYTFLNEELARHYGIAGVTGTDMRRVYLTDRRRGGVLTMGSVLTLSSYPQRTSPVLRGKWILADLLGTPPPPPPPVVATLSTDDAVDRDGLTFRQRLERHRQDPNCAGCHSRLDPLGFALENYDAIGRWRDRIGTVPIDAQGSMPDGTKFSGPAEFKKYMVSQKKADFTRHMVEKMLSYALGRGLEPYDLPSVRKIEARVAEEGYRAQTMIREVVLSYPFLYRQSDRKPAVKLAQGKG